MASLEPRTPAAHRAEFDHKLARVRDAFARVVTSATACAVTQSPTHGFRSRVRFQVIRRDARDADADGGGRLAYAMWARGAPSVVLDAPFTDAVPSVQGVMMPLLARVEAAPTLSRGLEAAHFLAEASRGRDVLVTLVYSNALDEVTWRDAAARLAATFTDVRVSVTGRSRGQTLRVGDDGVMETYTLSDGRSLRYKHTEGAFSNPNAKITEATMNFLCECARDVVSRAKPEASMLELYCGGGNHTCALAPMFRTIVGVEINATLVNAANENLALNCVTNVDIVLSDSQHVARRLLSGTFTSSGSRGVVSADDFDVVLVDPPRAGLDKETLKLVSTFEFVMYVSCGPDALLENIRDGLREHELKRFAVLDHFPFTKHIEVACLFHRRNA